MTRRLINQFSIFNFLEGARLALACVQVSKLQSFHGARKFPLNIEIIEFC